MSSTDVESLRPAPGQRGRCLDTFLLGSVLVLFVMVLSGAAAGAWALQRLHSRLSPEGVMSALTQREGLPHFDKGQNFAYVTANSSEVKNGSMMWKPINFSKGDSIGSRFVYNSNHHSLATVKEGPYFLYTQLSVSCVGPCDNGSLRVSFVDNTGTELLSCSLHLTFPERSVKKCWTVIPYLSDESQLMARMHTDFPAKSWRLDLNHSGFGMFLVDGP